MNRYPAIRNILSSLFSVQTGLDEDAIRTAYQRALTTDPELFAEVQKVLVDEEVNWCELLFNKEYEVYEAETANEAKAIGCKLLTQRD